MNHKMKGRKFNRRDGHRKALLRNLSKSLLWHEQITTTLPKAKDLQSVVEKLITFGKRGDLQARRRIISVLGGESAEVKKLFEVIGPRYEKRNGGYTRVIKAGCRSGDAAPLAVIELVDRDISAKGIMPNA